MPNAVGPLEVPHAASPMAATPETNAILLKCFIGAFLTQRPWASQYRSSRVFHEHWGALHQVVEAFHAILTIGESASRFAAATFPSTA
jgi:hypothetical protein